MSKFEGIKGEWRVEQNGFINEVRCGDSTIATVFNNGGLSAGEANARLIAAAPGLLEYAKKVVDLISEDGIYLELDAWSRNDILNLEHYVNKALGNE